MFFFQFRRVWQIASVYLTLDSGPSLVWLNALLLWSKLAFTECWIFVLLRVMCCKPIQRYAVEYRVEFGVSTDSCHCPAVDNISTATPQHCRKARFAIRIFDVRRIIRSLLCKINLLTYRWGLRGRTGHELLQLQPGVLLR